MAKELSEIEKELEAFFKFCSDSIMELRMNKAATDRQVTDLSQQSQQKSAEFLELRAMVNAVNQKLERLLSDEKAARLTDVCNLHNEIKAQIASIPRPQAPSLEDARSEFRAQLEPLLIDAQTANIKSDNSAKQLAIHEKRINQLVELIKQIQLRDAK